MNLFNYTDIEKLLPSDSVVRGNETSIKFSNIKPIFEADENSLVWVNPTRKDKANLIENTKAQVIICEKGIGIVDNSKIFIEVNNPKLVFSRIVDSLFNQSVIFGVHPTAVVHPEATIHPDTYIGPLNYIGKVSIGKGTIIRGNCHIADGTTIGNDVIIHTNVSIGGDGFGYVRNESGVLEKFPHIGGVVIEDNVEIGSNTCIDKGTLGNTLIKEGAKIDNLVHIAHNVIVGKNTAIIALSLIGGSTVIGDNSWIAPSSCLRDALTIGDNSTVGMGAVVTKNIPSNETWTGNPARPLNDFLSIQKKLKDL